MRGVTRLLALAVLCAAAAHASAADRSKTVKFPRGSSFDTERATIKGYDTFRYRLGANAGQTVSVLMEASNGACYFNFVPPSGGGAIHMGEVAGNEYSGRLPETGNYLVEVYMMRSAARRNEQCRYAITFEIR